MPSRGRRFTDVKAAYSTQSSVEADREKPMQKQNKKQNKTSRRRTAQKQLTQFPS
jgi:hypothetical protein